MRPLRVVTTGCAVVIAGLLAAASVGPERLPDERTMAVRLYVGRFLAAPWERLVERPYAIRSAPVLPVDRRSRLESVVRKAEESLRFVDPAPDAPGSHPPVAILHLEGTPYEMGYAYGRVLAREIRANVTRNMMPAVRKLAWPRQLRAAWRVVEPHIPDEYHAELRGIADGSGVKLDLLQQMHVVPEISEQLCSGYALNALITDDGYDYHVRVLDYATTLGVQRHPLVVFHRPLDATGAPTGYAYANIAWSGFDWSVGGVNATGFAIGEIGGGRADLVEGERPDGEPMGVLMRRVLNRATGVLHAEALIRDARRNMRYVYVLSDSLTSSRVLSGPEFFRVTRPGETLEVLGPGYDELPGFPEMVWHGANHETHIERFTRRHEGFALDHLMEHNRAVALRKNLQAWILRRGGCDGRSCETLDLWVFNALDGKYERAVDQPPVKIDLAAHFRELTAEDRSDRIARLP